MQAILKRATKSTPIIALQQGAYRAWLTKQPAAIRHWLKDFEPAAGQYRLLPDLKGGHIKAVLAILGDKGRLWDLAALPRALPAGNYRLADGTEGADRLALGWELGAYHYDRYKKKSPPPARLVNPAGVDLPDLSLMAQALCRGRDLINTPAEDLGPEELESAISAVGKLYGAKVTSIVGDQLLHKNFPLIHAVGRASHRPPRLVDLRWGQNHHPRVTLVGKGVCFDTGGLDLKPSSGMYLMKKDMGGAASALAVAEMVMGLKLPVQLRLLIPTADNAVSGNAFRPTDIFRSRLGLTVEIGNTDAEGRLLLADALALAVEDRPELMIDFATLTGAARSALGTSLPALFCNHDGLAAGLIEAGLQQQDPLWRLPLHDEYRGMLKTEIADLNSAPNSPYAGAITAALFLENFVGKTAWAHIDMMGWNLTTKAGRPVGGEPMAARAVLGLLQKRYQVS
jgi:leucyl aminopeptidase